MMEKRLMYVKDAIQGPATPKIHDKSHLFP